MSQNVHKYSIFKSIKYILFSVAKVICISSCLDVVVFLSSRKSDGMSGYIQDRSTNGSMNVYN